MTLVFKEEEAAAAAKRQQQQQHKISIKVSLLWEINNNCLND